MLVPSPNVPPSNGSVTEVVVTVVLAVLVCVVAAILLNTGFYRDLWVFWFCFVVGTAHFSLIKVRWGEREGGKEGREMKQLLYTSERVQLMYYSGT